MWYRSKQNEAQEKCNPKFTCTGSDCKLCNNNQN